MNSKFTPDMKVFLEGPIFLQGNVCLEIREIEVTPKVTSIHGMIAQRNNMPQKLLSTRPAMVSEIYAKVQQLHRGHARGQVIFDN